MTTDLEHAKSLIDQGKIVDAQSILTPLIYSNPHDIPAWFLYVETLDSTVKRLRVLEICLIELSNKHRTNGRVAIFLKEGAFEGVGIQFVQKTIC